MGKELVLHTRNNDLERQVAISWDDFVNRFNFLTNDLQRRYDSSSTERREDFTKDCRGGYNFAKTLQWVVDYSPNLEAFESIASALYGIVDFQNAGSLASEMRKFIEHAVLDYDDEYINTRISFDNVSSTIEFGKLLSNIGKKYQTGSNGKKQLSLDIDSLVLDLGWGRIRDDEPEEILKTHMDYIDGIMDYLKIFLDPNIINVEREPTKEELDEKAVNEKEQYRKDFLTDAKSFYKNPSFFDVLNKKDLINRPFHKILNYPSALMEIGSEGYKDADDAVTSYYECKDYMIEKRTDPNLESHMTYTMIPYHDQFEKRLKRTQEIKPWMIDFSRNWMDTIGYSNIIGNRDTRSAGKITYLFNNRNQRGNEYRELESFEEKELFESITDVQSLGEQKTPLQRSLFNGIHSADAFRLIRGELPSVKIYVHRDCGSIYADGKLIVDGIENPIFAAQATKRID